MRDFEQDRRICEAATKGPWKAIERGNSVTSFAVVTVAYLGEPQKNICSLISPKTSNAEFISEAREGWPAALDEIQNLKLQLLSAGVFAASQPHCPDGKDCDGYSTSEQSCTACWLEHWRQKSGTFQNGNNHRTTSKTETVGEGAE